MTITQVPIVVTGGDTAHGEVVRGVVLLIHYDEAEDNPAYAEEMLEEAVIAAAPESVVTSLEEICERHRERKS